MKKFLHNHFVLAVAFVIANLFLVSAAFAQSPYTSVASGNWNSDATWSGTGVPVAGDVVNIVGGFNVTLTANAACASITFTTATATSLTLGAFQLDVSGLITIPRSGSGENLIAVGAGTLNAGSISFTSGGGGVRHEITISTGTVKVTGDVTQSGSTGSASITFTSTGLLQLGGAFLTSGTGTLTPSTGTVEYNGTIAQTVGDFTYNNLTISGSNTKTLAGNTTVNGILIVKAGTTLAKSTFTLGSPTSVVLEGGATAGSIISGSAALTLGGNVTVNSAGTGSSGASISSPVALGATRTFTVADDGTAASDLSMSGIVSGSGFGVTKTGAGTLTFSAANSYTGATTITAGELRLNPAANTTPNTQVVLNGGKLSTTGITATRTITNSSTLNLNASSSIDLGSNVHSLIFANSSGISWAGTTLTINGWTGTGGSSGTGGKIFFGATTGTLTAAQLAKISFTGHPGTPLLLSTGELVPPVAAPALSITGTTNHGGSCVGTPATTITYTITNTAATAAAGISVTSNNPQFVVSNLSSTTINANGGTATYQVTFTPGSTGAQNATITVASTTPGSNSPTSSLTGTGNPSPVASVTGQSNINCFAANDGTITISASGGTGPYSYSVDNGLNWVSSATNPYVYPGLSANIAYKVRVKDNNGCASRSVQ